MLDQYRVLPIVGVIPACADPKFKGVYALDEGFWEKARNWKQKGWTIALHGYQHLYGSQLGGINPVNQYSEYAGVDFETQRKMIRDGVRILNEHGLEAELFFAPAHTFDKNTLAALKEESAIRIVSDTISSDVYFDDGIWFIPLQSGKARSLPVKTATFCYHPNSMSEKDFKHLDCFLKKNLFKALRFSKMHFPKRKLGCYDRLLKSGYFGLRKARKFLVGRS